MSSNPGGGGVVEHLKNTRWTTFLLGGRSSVGNALGSTRPNAAVGLLASVRVLYSRNLHTPLSISERSWEKHHLTNSCGLHFFLFPPLPFPKCSVLLGHRYPLN